MPNERTVQSQTHRERGVSGNNMDTHRELAGTPLRNHIENELFLLVELTHPDRDRRTRLRNGHLLIAGDRQSEVSDT